MTLLEGMTGVRPGEIFAVEHSAIDLQAASFPTPTGKHFKLSNFHMHWNAIRALAGMPGLHFYDLKHRAITWMVTAPPHGLGLDPPTVATIVGHRDAGATNATHYLRLDQRRALDRALQAKAAFDGARARPLRALPR